MPLFPLCVTITAFESARSWHAARLHFSATMHVLRFYDSSPWPSAHLTCSYSPCCTSAFDAHRFSYPKSSYTRQKWASRLLSNHATTHSPLASLETKLVAKCIMLMLFKTLQFVSLLLTLTNQSGLVLDGFADFSPILCCLPCSLRPMFHYPQVTSMLRRRSSTLTTLCGSLLPYGFVVSSFAFTMIVISHLYSHSSKTPPTSHHMSFSLAAPLYFSAFLSSRGSFSFPFSVPLPHPQLGVTPIAITFI